MKKFLAAALLLVSTAAFAQQTDDWKISAQLQARTELDGRDFSNSTYPINFASLRTRLGVEKTFANQLNAMIQIQDSRVFGEEPSTLSSIDNIDLHQAYFKLMNIFDSNLDLQVGRFEMKYGTERFFGAVGWHYVGRSFDGVKLSLKAPVKIDFFGLSTKASRTYVGNAVPGIYPEPVSPDPSYSIYGFWNQNKLNDGMTNLDVFGYYEIDRNKNTFGQIPLSRATIGMTYIGNYEKLLPIVEIAAQTGSMAEQDLSAYLISVQTKYKLKNNMKIGAGFDLLSGSDPEDGLLNTFAPSYGTNHKFYGFMDYFINVPANTFGLGLNDIYLMYDLKINDAWNFSADLHYFTTNKSIDNPLTGNKESGLGQELDLTLKYNFIKGTTLTWGGSIFMQDDLMKLAFTTAEGPREDTAFWTYLMATINL